MQVLVHLLRQCGLDRNARRDPVGGAEGEAKQQKPSSRQVACHYRYVVAGKDYESTRIGVADWAASDRGLHEQRFQSLETARIRKAPWPALVDPSDPAKAMLFRDVDLSMYLMPLLGLMVGGIGAAFMKHVLGQGTAAAWILPSSEPRGAAAPSAVGRRL